MNTKTLVLSCVICLIALIILGSCATSQNPDKMVFERFCGTWVNTEYEGKEWPPVKVIYKPDGTLTIYTYLHDTASYGRATYTVEKRWADSEGNSWYHIKMQWAWGSTSYQYMLFKLDKYTTILEYNYSGTKYPDTVDPKDWHSDYRIYYRY